MSDVENLLRKYGEDVTVTRGGVSGRERAFILPREMTYSADDRFVPEHLGIGENERLLSILRGSLDALDAWSDTVTYGGREYRIVNAVRFRVERENSHWECVLEKREEPFIDGD